MPSNAGRQSSESVQDILDYLGFAGFATTRDQLVRMHRRRLVGSPYPALGAEPGVAPTYPDGTAERMLRIAQFRSSTKQLDELAWRLWWEGHDVDPELIRGFLSKKAARWDEQFRELRLVAPVASVEVAANGERDVLDEVFFQHLKTGPSSSVKRRLGRGSELYSAFASLFIDVLEGDFSHVEAGESGLFERSSCDPYAEQPIEPAPDSRGDSARATMRASMEQTYVQSVESLDDKEIAGARDVAVRFLAVIANVGSIVLEAFGGVGHGRDNLGKSLVTLAEGPDEQVLSLLLTSAFLTDDRVRHGLTGLRAAPMPTPSISFRDFLRLRFLAEEVPELGALLEPSRVREVFVSQDAATTWRDDLERFRDDHELELDDAMSLRGDLFDEEPPEMDEETPTGSPKLKKKI